MTQKKLMSVAIVLGWATTSGVAIIVPILLIPSENRSDFYVYRLLWIQFLVLVFWASWGIYAFLPLLNRKDSGGYGGALPLMSLIMTCYVFLSFLLLIAEVLTVDDSLIQRFHLILQVLLGGVVLICISVLFFTISANSSDYNSYGDSKVKSPKDLATMLQYYEDTLSADIELKGTLQSLKSLREKLLYSLPHSGQIYASQEYASLCAEVQQLCSKFNAKNIQPPCKDEIESLESKVRYISNSLQR